MNSNDSTKNKRRYTPEEKQSVLDFIAERKTQNKRGAQKEAAERFGISTVTISSWMKATKAKRGRKPGTKIQPLPKLSLSLRPSPRTCAAWQQSWKKSPTLKPRQPSSTPCAPKRRNSKTDLRPNRPDCV